MPASSLRLVCLHLARVSLLACLVSPVPATAQDAAPPPATAGAPASASSSEYRLGPGDRITVGVSGLNQLGQSARVTNGGKMHLPYLGIMKVAGLTSAELEALIARQLKERGLVNEAWVNVRVDQYRAQPVYVLGEVMSPGQFVIKDEMYLTDLITLSGGFNEKATPTGFLYRRKEKVAGTPEGDVPADDAIPIDFAALNEGTRPELNVKLRGGDVLYVPERRAEYFFVVGDVGIPGHFELAAGVKTLPVTQAIAKAGGPLRTAKMSAGLLVHFNPDGTREEIKVDFKAILEGRHPDVFVRPNDIVFIPGSAGKTIGYGLLGAIPGMAGQRAVTR